MSKSSSDILTVEEAAELLKIPRSSVDKLTQEGITPGKKLAGIGVFIEGIYSVMLLDYLLWIT